MHLPVPGVSVVPDRAVGHQLYMLGSESGLQNH